MRDRQREAVADFLLHTKVVVEANASRSITISWTFGDGVYQSMTSNHHTVDELIVKIPRVARKWEAAEDEDRKNAGPETT